MKILMRLSVLLVVLASSVAAERISPMDCGQPTLIITRNSQAEHDLEFTISVRPGGFGQTLCVDVDIPRKGKLKDLFAMQFHLSPGGNHPDPSLNLNILVQINDELSIPAKQDETVARSSFSLSRHLFQRASLRLMIGKLEEGYEPKASSPRPLIWRHVEAVYLIDLKTYL